MTKPQQVDTVTNPETLRAALRQVVDPEAGVNIVDLGLIYSITIADGVAQVAMTMTSAACPMGEMIVEEVEAALRAALPAGMDTNVELVWSPPWDPSMMSEAARRHFEW